MKIEKNQITFPKALNAKWSGKVVEETETELTLEGEDEESYVKFYTPFRGVAKLLLFEDARWVDAETSAALSSFDLSALGLDAFPDTKGSAKDTSKDNEPIIHTP